MSRIALPVLLLLFALPVASAFAHPHPQHRRDPDKIRALEALDAPDLFTPPATSTLTLRSAVRRVNGLRAEGRDDRDEDDDDNGHATAFLVRACWTLSQNGVVVRQLTREVEVKPPLSVISLPTRNGRGSKTFARVDISTTFDGRSGSGAMLSGVVSYQAFAEFVRIKTRKDKTKELVIDDSQVLDGTVTIQTGASPLMLTVTSPQDGALTREASITVTGTVSGDPPLSLTIQGQAVSLAPDGSFTHVVSLAQEGANTISLLASGSGQTAQKTLTVVRDSVSPVLSIVEPAHGSASSDTTPLFRIAYSDAAPSSSLDLTTLKVTLNGSDVSASFAAGPTEATFTPSAALADGDFVVTALVKDRAGNASALATSSFTIDTAAPSLTVEPTSGAVLQSGQVTFTATHSDSGSGLLSTSLSATLDGQPVSFTVGTTQSTFTPSPALADGPHALAVSIRDRAGNAASAQTTVVVDSRPPAVSISPADGSFTNNAQPQLRVSYADPAPSSDLALNSLEIMIDGVVSTSQFTVSASEATFTPTSPLSEGTHTILASIQDRAGNTSGTVTSRFTVDATSPALTLSPESGAYVASSTPELVATYADANLVTTSFSATLDGQAVTFTVGATRATFTPTSPLSAASSHTLVVRIADAAGNATERTSTFRIDDADPAVTLAPSPSSVLASGAATITVSFTDAGSGVDPSTVSLIVDGVNRSGDLIVGASHATLSVQLADGSHTAEASAKDRVGRQGSASSTFRVDSQPPELTIVQPSGGQTLATTTPRFEVTFADPGGSGVVTSTFKAIISGVDRTSAFTVTPTGATLDLAGSQGLSAGSQTFAVEIADAAGLRTARQVSFTITQPVAGPQGVLVGQIFSGDVCNSQPIAGASVTLLHHGAVATTDALGRFRLSAPIGTAWVEVDKAGFLSVQRSGQVVEGQESTLATIFLAAEDSRVTHVVASEGGTVTDSTGNATMIIPPGALPQDADVRMTLIADARASKGPPQKNFIPGTAVRITPDRVQLNQYATVRVKNFMHMPVHPIFAFDWNPDGQVWERTVGAVITADGQFFESYINHFSGSAPGCGPLGPPGGGGGNGPGGCRCCGSGPAPSPFGKT